MTARIDAQAASFLRAVVPALRELHQLGSLVRWTDTTIAFARVSDDPSLVLSASQLASAASTIVQATESIEPPASEPDLAGWRALADELHGRVVPGSLDIDAGKIGRAPVAITVEWTRRPVTTSVRVGAMPDAPLAAAAVYGGGHAVPEAIAQLVDAQPVDVSDVTIAHGTARARRGLRGAAEVREVVDYLYRLLAAFDAPTGVYR